MANEEHLEIIQQGKSVWNAWRQKHPEVVPDLSGANLSNTNLSGANLSNANLRSISIHFCDLSNANLSEADLSNANLFGVTLSGATLSNADLRNADLSTVNLSEADLSNANLFGVTLRSPDLSNATLSGANLSNATFRSPDLSGANFLYTVIGWTLFCNVDLREVKGLESVKHEGPSTIGMDTLMRSAGDIPASFLKGAGISDELIEYAKSLVRRAIEYYTCFICYSSQDQDFAERLYADLQNKGVRCWYAPKDLKIGDYHRHEIEQSIRMYDKLLLILSKESIRSAWVEKEVEQAYDKEEQMDMSRQVLFPIRIDETVMQTTRSWAATLRDTRHIGDFTRWKDHDDYQKAFARLLSDLQPDKTSKGE